MEAFIRSDQFHYIEEQTKHLTHSHATVNDPGVLDALNSVTAEKVHNLFTHLSEEQEALVGKVIDVEDQADATLYLSRIRQYVLPFQIPSDQIVQDLFPKVKKIKTPSIAGVDERDLTYLGWNDYSANRKYIVTKLDGEWIGLHGSFTLMQKNNICSICHGHEKVGLFTSTVSESSQTDLKRGNYICQDSVRCNENIAYLEPLKQFIAHMTQPDR